MHMITFHEKEDMPKHTIYEAYLDNDLVGKARLFNPENSAPELQLFSLTEKGRGTLSESELFTLFCDFLREKGYKALHCETDDDSLDILRHFELLDRDNSGWDPKYIYHMDL